MDQTSKDQAPPAQGEASRLRTEAAAFLQADIAIAGKIARSRGTSVDPADIHRLDDGGLSITTKDGATTTVDPAAVAAERASGENLEIASRYVLLRDAGRRSVRLARRLGRDSAHVPYSYRDAGGVLRTASKSIVLAPRRGTAGRGRSARQATNHRSAGSRRTAASSSTSSADPGDPDPPAQPRSLLRLAPPSRAVLAFGVLNAERRGDRSCSRAA